MAAKILIVDSDHKVGTELVTYLRNQGLLAVSVTSCVDAAMVINHECPDLAVIDQDIPLTGIKVAQIIRLKPETMALPVILGVKPGNPERTRQLIKLAIQNGVSWVTPRPYKPQMLLQKMQEILGKSARSTPQKPTPEELSLHIRKQIRTLTELPVLSPSHQRLINILAANDDHVDVNELIDAIQSDQALTMRTLRIARSAGYGYQGNLLPTAITFLGIKNVRQIVQGATFLNIFGQKGDQATYKAFWEHSLACAMVMQLISRDNQASKHFMAGLLHDVGKLVLTYSFPPFAKAIKAAGNRTCRPSHEVEYQLLGITHSEIGQEIALLWNLPNEITESIVNHHAPSQAARHKLITALVYTADVAVRKMGIGHSGNYATPSLDDEFARNLKLPIPFEELQGKKSDIMTQIRAIVNS